MNLTDSQKIKLREEIEKVLNEDRLKAILLEREGKFGRNFYNQISGDDYRTRLVDLIKELNNRELINDFIAVVGNDYPQVKCHYQIYKQLSALVFIFKDCLRISSNFIKTFFNYDTIENLEEHLLELIDDNGNDPLLDKISSSDKLKRLDSYLDLKDFVEKKVTKILTAPDINDNLKQRLREWIEQNFTKIDFSSEAQTQSTLQSYLLIIIYPLRGQTKTNRNKIFNVQAEFIENFPTTPNRKVELNQEDVKEQGYVEKEIPNIIYKFIDKVENQDEFLRSKVFNNQAFTLKIELFLPTDCLTKEFEFKSPDIWKRDKVVICERYSVILRSFDRFYQTSWHNSCLQKWTQIKTIKREQILDLNQENDLNKLLAKPEGRKQLKLRLERIIIVKISEGLPKEKGKIADLFNIILEKGIPLCFWIKSKDNVDYPLISNQLTDLINLEYFEDINRLYEQIFEMRKNHFADPNPEKCLGYYLGVLCDNTDRKPISLPNFNQLTA